MLARPQSKVFSAEKGLRVDSVNFQPCPRARTQDRYAVKELDVYGRKWSLTGVFDGASRGSRTNNRRSLFSQAAKVS